VSGSEDMTIKFWDVKNYLTGKSFTGHTAGIYKLARLSNGYLVSTGEKIIFTFNIALLNHV
jgi:WD40 repeat protein